MDPTLLSTLIGAGGGALQGGLEFGEARKQRKREEEASRPKRRRLYQLQQGLNSMAQQRMAGLNMLSSAAADWAGSLRY